MLGHVNVYVWVEKVHTHLGPQKKKQKKMRTVLGWTSAQRCAALRLWVAAACSNYLGNPVIASYHSGSAPHRRRVECIPPPPPEWCCSCAWRKGSRASKWKSLFISLWLAWKSSTAKYDHTVCVCVCVWVRDEYRYCNIVILIYYSFLVTSLLCNILLFRYFLPTLPIPNV